MDSIVLAFDLKCCAQVCSVAHPAGRRWRPSALGLTQRQVKCQAQHHTRLDCEFGIAGLPARVVRRAACQPSSTSGVTITSNCLDAEVLHCTPPIPYPKLHLWDVVAPQGVVLVRH